MTWSRRLQTRRLRLIPKLGTDSEVSDICLNVSLQPDPLYSVRLVRMSHGHLSSSLSALLRETPAGQTDSGTADHFLQLNKSPLCFGAIHMNIMTHNDETITVT